MKRESVYEDEYTEEQLRTMKQAYLKTNVMDEGFDPASFAQFMEYKMGKYFTSLNS